MSRILSRLAPAPTAVNAAKDRAGQAKEDVGVDHLVDHVPIRAGVGLVEERAVLDRVHAGGNAYGVTFAHLLQAPTPTVATPPPDALLAPLLAARVATDLLRVLFATHHPPELQVWLGWPCREGSPSGRWRRS